MMDVSWKEKAEYWFKMWQECHLELMDVERRLRMQEAAEATLMRELQGLLQEDDE